MTPLAGHTSTGLHEVQGSAHSAESSRGLASARAEVFRLRYVNSAGLTMASGSEGAGPGPHELRLSLLAAF